MEFIVFITIIWFHCYHIRKQCYLLPVRLAQSQDFRSNLYQRTLMKSVSEKWIKSGIFSHTQEGRELGNIFYHTFNSTQMYGSQWGSPVAAFIYYKSLENPYQVTHMSHVLHWQSNEIKGSIIITIVQRICRCWHCYSCYAFVTNKLMIFFLRALYCGDSYIKDKLIFSPPSMLANCSYKLFLNITISRQDLSNDWLTK